MELAYVNGWLGSLEEARVSVNDRGYNFGDGVYEVVRAYNGVMFALEEHLNRMALSAAAVEIDLPWSPDQLKNIIEEILDKSGIREALVYIQVTRGTAPRSHVSEEEMRPNLLVTVRDMPDIPPSLYTKGVKAITMPEFRWQMCNVKSISLQASVLAKRRAERAGAAEAFFVLPDGTVTEGASSNIFIVKDGALMTHPADNRVLAGVIRHFVLKVAGTTGVKAMEEPFKVSDMMGSEEVFITGTVAEVVPVVNVDGKTIGGGRPGPLTARIHKGFVSFIK